MSMPNSDREFAERYNKITIKLEDTLNGMFNQPWEILSARTVEVDLANGEPDYYREDLVEILDYYNSNGKSDPDYELNLKELRDLLSYINNK